MSAKSLKPRICTSRLSRYLSHGGLAVELCIYRLQTESQWRVEVVNNTGASYLWDDLFSSAKAANEGFLRAVSEEGLAMFQEGGEVIPFGPKNAGDAASVATMRRKA
jgi:hypothetical protein